MIRGSIVLEEKYSNPYEQKRVEIVKSLLSRGDGRAALDIGCGSGHFTGILSELGWQVTAIDAEPRNIAQAGSFATTAICGDVVDVLRSLPSGSYDFICALEIIEHLDAREDLLQELRRVAAPGGTLLLSTPNRISPEGLDGYYWGERIRKRKWTAWDPTHVYIYSSFEILRALRRYSWNPKIVVGYHYGGRLALPFVVTRRFPWNRLGFNTLVLAEAR